jgi:hypothetical protein
MSWFTTRSRAWASKGRMEIAVSRRSRRLSWWGNAGVGEEEEEEEEEEVAEVGVGRVRIRVTKELSAKPTYS